ncbi:MAG: glutaredoxin family protein [Terriglobia bacterium]
MAADSQIVVYSKPGCCLCDKVRAQLQLLQKQRPFEWSEVNILEDPAAAEKFKEQIPVVFINGQMAFRYHLDEKEFLKLL